MNLFTKVNPLSVILIVVGAEPTLSTKPGSAWWKKINPLGGLICVIQLVLIIFGYLNEQERVGVRDHYTNNILRITIIYKQTFTVCQPFVFVLAKLCKIRRVEMLNLKMQHFDRLISSWKHPGQHKKFKESLKIMEEINSRWKLIAALSLVVGEVINIFIGAYYILKTTGIAATFETFYFYQVAVVHFVACAFDIGITLTGVKMRLHMVLELQRSVVREISMDECQKMKVRELFVQ